MRKSVQTFLCPCGRARAQQSILPQPLSGLWGIQRERPSREQEGLSAGQSWTPRPLSNANSLRDGHAFLHDGPQYWLSGWISRPDAESPEPDVLLPKLDAPTIPPVQGPVTAWTAAAFLCEYANAAGCPWWSYDALRLSPTICRYVG